MTSPTSGKTDAESNDKEGVHSGHFMMSQLDEEEQDTKSRDKLYEMNSRNFNTYVYGQHSDHTIAIDASLTKLFECMTLAYSGKITSPRWKPFRGTKLTLKDKVRLNNIIWREWTMQYIYLRRSIICQFAAPLCDDVHTKPEAVVLEGKYWKRKLDTVTAEYKKCRKYFKQLALRRHTPNVNDVSVTELLERVGEVVQSVPTGEQMSPDSLFMTLIDDDFAMDFSDSLFTTLNTPFAFPTPKDLYRTGYRNVIQPGLAQLQPNLDDMDTFDPIQEMITQQRLQMCMAASANMPGDVPCMDVLGDELMPYTTDLPLIHDMPPNMSPLSHQSSPLLSHHPNPLLSHHPNPLLSHHPNPLLSYHPTPLLSHHPTPFLSQQSHLLQLRQPSSVLPQQSNPPLIHNQPSPQLLSQQPTPLLTRRPTPLSSQQTAPILARVPFTDLKQTATPAQQLITQPITNIQANTNTQLFMQTNPGAMPRQGALILPQQNQLNSQSNLPFSIQQFLQTALSNISNEPLPASSQVGPFTNLSNVNITPQNPNFFPRVHAAPMNLSSSSLPVFDQITTIDVSALLEEPRAPANTESILTKLIAEPADVSKSSPRRTQVIRPPPPCTQKDKAEAAFVVPKGKPIQRKQRPIAPALSLQTAPVSPTLNSTCLAQLLTTDIIDGVPGTYMCTSLPMKDEQFVGGAGPQIPHLTPIRPNVPLPPLNVVQSQPSPSHIILNVPYQSPTMIQVQASSNKVVTSLATRTRKISDERERKVSGDRVRKASGDGRKLSSDTVATVKRAAAVAINEVKPLVSQPVSEPSVTNSLHTVVTESGSPTPSDMEPMHMFMLMDVDKQGYQEQRRVTHISAEKKRRCNIKSGFDVLHVMVPALRVQSHAKVSKAVMLLKTAEYCRKLKQDRSQSQKELSVLKQEIESLNSSIMQSQSQLPETGVPITRQRVDRMKDMFDEYVKTRTVQNWKFWIFSIFIGKLFDSFNNMVSTASQEDLYRTVVAWLDQHCTLLHLRPLVLTSLRTLSTTTSILSDPDAVREQAITTVTHQHKKAATDKFK